MLLQLLYICAVSLEYSYIQIYDQCWDWSARCQYTVTG